MRLLAIDTTGERLSVALEDRGRVRSRVAARAANQDDQLPAEVSKLLRAARLKPKDIDAFVAPTGPGRFTGIRVGLTFAGILAKALGKKAIGVSWLEACAWRSAAADPIVAVVPGWKGEFFFQVFRRSAEGPVATRPPRWSDPAGLAKRIEEDLEGADRCLVGPGAEEALKLLPGRAVAEPGDVALDASALLAPARAQLERGRFAEFAPLYLKPAHYEK